MATLPVTVGSLSVGVDGTAVVEPARYAQFFCSRSTTLMSTASAPAERLVTTSCQVDGVLTAALATSTNVPGDCESSMVFARCGTGRYGVVAADEVLATGIGSGAVPGSRVATDAPNNRVIEAVLLRVTVAQVAFAAPSAVPGRTFTW